MKRPVTDDREEGGDYQANTSTAASQGAGDDLALSGRTVGVGAAVKLPERKGFKRVGPASCSSGSNNGGQRADPCIGDGVAIAFTAIWTGAFGCPVEEVARVAMGTVVEAAGSFELVKPVRFVLFGAGDLEVHECMLAGTSGAG